MGGLLTFQTHSLRGFCGAMKAPGFSWASQSTDLRTALPVRAQEPLEVAVWIQEPSFLRASVPRLLSLPTAPSCLPLSAGSPASWLGLTQSSFSPQQGSLASPHRDPSASLCSSLILCVILKKKIQMSQFLFSEQDVGAPWCV